MKNRARLITALALLLVYRPIPAAAQFHLATDPFPLLSPLSSLARHSAKRTARSEVRSRMRSGPAPGDLAKIQEQLRQNREEDLEDNGFWLDALETAYANGDDPRDMLAYEVLVDGLTIETLQQAAQRYLNTGNYVKVVLLPEGFVGNSAVLESYSDPVPQAFVLEQNHPNPFNGGTVIRFALPQSGEVELSVYNLAGQKVVILLEGQRQAGLYEVHWDGRDAQQQSLASGIYLYSLQVGQQVETRKLSLVR